MAAVAFACLAGFIFWMLLRRREHVAAAERLHAGAARAARAGRARGAAPAGEGEDREHYDASSPRACAATRSSASASSRVARTASCAPHSSAPVSTALQAARSTRSCAKGTRSASVTRSRIRRTRRTRSARRSRSYDARPPRRSTRSRRCGRNEHAHLRHRDPLRRPVGARAARARRHRRGAASSRRERGRSGGVLFSSLGLLPRAHGSWRVRLRWLLLPLRVVAATALIVALAAPSVVQAAFDVPAEGIDIVIVVDTSSSMTTPDLDGQPRIDVVKKVVHDFLGGLKNDRVGDRHLQRRVDGAQPADARLRGGAASRSSRSRRTAAA